jgi:hypothetical protein
MLHQEDAFEEVHYSEPMNVLVAVPLEESEFDGPYAIFGLKAARGYHKDYRFIDKGIEGAGSYYINEEEVDMLLQNPKKAIRELNQEYFGRIGMHPKSRERLDESVVNEKSKSETQQRLFGMVYAYKQGELDLDDLDDDLAEKIKSIADDISMEDAKDFAETDHDDIPPEVKEEAFRKGARAYIKKHVKLKNVLSEQEIVSGSNNIPQSINSALQTMGLGDASRYKVYKEDMQMGEPIYIVEINPSTLPGGLSLNANMLSSVAKRSGLRQVKFDGQVAELWFDG